MGDLFLNLLNRSITGGWLILAVLCIRLLLKKIPKWTNCLLWGALAIRLACPFSIESPFCVLPSAEPVRSSSIVEGKTQNFIPSIDSRLTIVKNTINPMLANTFAYDESESAAPLQTFTYAAGFIWAFGAILLAIYAMAGAIKLRQLVREAVCVRDNLYICDAVASPFIMGLLRPRIYLSSALHEKEMSYILAHESAHLKRKDHWWKALGYFLLCIYWFHPLYWIAYSLFCKDMELACDEKAAKGMTFHEKKEYAGTLLSCAVKKRLILVCPLAFGETGVKERVTSVLNYKKPTLWLMLTAVAICAIFTLCFLTNPAKRQQIKITVPAESKTSFFYSDEEISPKGNTLKFYSDEGLGDTEIKLIPVDLFPISTDGKNEYLTKGMPVKLDAKKGVWYKIGVMIQNPTEESRDVYLSVSGAEVRIACNDDDAAGSLSTKQTPAEHRPIKNATLYEHPKANNVCIKLQPSILREQPYYYYIPTGKNQKRLLKQVKALDLEGQPFDLKGTPLDIRWEGHKEMGWQIFYNGAEIRAFDGGYLYYTYEGENERMECVIKAPKLCDFIQRLLTEEIGYGHYDVSDIKGIVSAKLDVNCAFTGGKFYSQTVTDVKTLQKFEKWFCNAEYIFGGAECGNQCACLELTLSDGNVVKLSMATDSCPIFNLDGVAYDYRPKPDWNNMEFYKCFADIPWGL